MSIPYSAALRDRSLDGADLLVGVTHLTQHLSVGRQKLGSRSGRESQDFDLGAAGLHLRLDDLKPRGGFGLRELQLQSLELRGNLGAFFAAAPPVPIPSGPLP